MRGRENENKVFTDPNEWGMELWRQNITGVVKTIWDDVKIREGNHGVFILHLINIILGVFWLILYSHDLFVEETHNPL